jgi:hypothetical protein
VARGAALRSRASLDLDLGLAVTDPDRVRSQIRFATRPRFRTERLKIKRTRLFETGIQTRSLKNSQLFAALFFQVRGRGLKQRLEVVSENPESAGTKLTQIREFSGSSCLGSISSRGNQRPLSVRDLRRGSIGIASYLITKSTLRVISESLHFKLIYSQSTFDRLAEHSLSSDRLGRP